MSEPAAPQACTEMASDKIKALVLNVQALQLGEDREKVIAVLGKPSMDLGVARKESNVLTGRMLYYFAKKCGPFSVADDRDQVVKLLFDVSDHLTLVESINVSGVQTRPDITGPLKSRNEQ